MQNKNSILKVIIVVAMVTVFSTNAFSRNLSVLWADHLWPKILSEVKKGNHDANTIWHRYWINTWQPIVDYFSVPGRSGLHLRQKIEHWAQKNFLGPIDISQPDIDNTHYYLLGYNELYRIRAAKRVFNYLRSLFIKRYGIVYPILEDLSVNLELVIKTGKDNKDNISTNLNRIGFNQKNIKALFAKYDNFEKYFEDVIKPGLITYINEYIDKQITIMKQEVLLELRNDKNFRKAIYKEMLNDKPFLKKLKKALE